MLLLLPLLLKVTDEERVAELKTEYKSKHPNAFWIDFGDFSVYEAQELVQVRLVGGFARAGSIKPDDFLSAEVDEILKFSEPVCGHMNDDHVEQIPMVCVPETSPPVPFPFSLCS